MKKLIAIGVAGIVSAMLFAACATTMTPATIATALCVPTEAAVSTIEALAKENPTNSTAVAGAAALAKIQPVITAVCTAASTVTSTALQTLITSGLPALGTIIGSLPLPAATITNLENGFSAAEALVDMVDVVVLNIKSAQQVSAVMAPSQPTLKAPTIVAPKLIAPVFK